MRGGTGELESNGVWTNKLCPPMRVGKNTRYQHLYLSWASPNPTIIYGMWFYDPWSRPLVLHTACELRCHVAYHNSSLDIFDVKMAHYRVPVIRLTGRMQSQVFFAVFSISMYRGHQLTFSCS